MKVKFETRARPMNIAKAIKRYIQKNEGEITKSRCFELTAWMFGYRNWNELLAHIGSESPSLPDSYAGDELFERVTQYLQALQRLGLGLDEAWDLLVQTSAGPWLGVGRFLERSTYEALMSEDAKAVA